MVKCITNRTITLPSSSCQGYDNLLLKISSIVGRFISDFRVFFIDPRGFYTEIQSDADVLGVRYISKTSDISFKVEVSMSRQEVEHLIINEQINQYLASSYRIIASKIVQEQMKLATQLYLHELYAQIAQRQSIINMIEEEEISQFIAKMNNQITQKIIEESSPIIRQVKQKNNQGDTLNVSAQIGLQKNIQMIVSCALQSFMPLIVKGISDRIIDELRNGKINIFNIVQKDQNPEEV